MHPPPRFDAHAFAFHELALALDRVALAKHVVVLADRLEAQLSQLDQTQREGLGAWANEVLAHVASVPIERRLL